MLNMRSAHDRTALARIRDAAIEQFGRYGFDVSVRTIAEAAGVSAALVIHHYGSKDGLRQACDDEVLNFIRDEKTEAIQSTDPATWLAQLADIESYGPLVSYLMRSLQTGGQLGEELLRRTADDVEHYLESGVRAGTIKPSRDPRARARFLALNNIGGLLLYLQPYGESGDMRAALRNYTDELVLPVMELYTHGLMADSTMYDAIVAEYTER